MAQPPPYTGTVRKSTRKNFGVPPSRFPEIESWPIQGTDNQNYGNDVEECDIRLTNQPVRAFSKASSKKSKSTKSNKSKLAESIQTLQSLQEMDELEKEMAAIQAEEIESRKLEVMRRMKRLRDIENQKIVIQEIAENESSTDDDDEDDVFLSVKDERVSSWVDNIATLKPTNSWNGGHVKANDFVPISAGLKKTNSVRSINLQKKENRFPPKQFENSTFKEFQPRHQQFYTAQPRQTENVTSNDVLLAAFKALQIKQVRDLPVFNGENVLEWPNFAAEFKRSTNESNIQPETNLRRLNNALKGIARESVQGLLSHPENIDEIMSTLEMNFGRPEWIIVKLLSDLRAFPAMKEEGIEQFRSFYNKINNVSCTMKNLNAERYTDSPDLLNCMEEKLPQSTKGYWIRHKADLLRNGKPVTLSALGEWFKYELDVQYAGTSVKDISKRQGNTSTNYRNVRNVLHVNDQNEKSSYCIKCRTTGHTIDECKAFKEMKVEERRHFALKQNVCFLCLGRKHSVKTCLKKDKIVA